MAKSKHKDKYIGSPWGTIIGKLGPVVGYVVRGRKRLRMHRRPQVKGSIEYIKKAIKGEVPISSVIVSQANEIRSFCTLSRIARLSANSIIRPVWDPIAQKKHFFGGFYLFQHENFHAVYDFIPNPKNFISYKNLPPLTNMWLTDGITYPSPILKAHFLTTGRCEPYQNPDIRHLTSLSSDNTDSITVEWDTYGNPSDDVHLFAIYWKLPETSKWYGTLRPWEGIKVWGDAKKSLAKRQDGKATLLLSHNSSLIIHPSFLTVFLAFSKGKDYSRSSAKLLDPISH